MIKKIDKQPKGSWKFDMEFGIYSWLLHRKLDNISILDMESLLQFSKEKVSTWNLESPELPLEILQSSLSFYALGIIDNNIRI